jgi:hypothetical protein
MLEHFDDLHHVWLVFNAFDPQGALAHGMERNIPRNRLVDAICKAEPTQASRGKDQAVVRTAVEFLQTGNHIAADVFELQMGVVMS